MVTRKSPRKGSLQFWPRKRVNKFLPRVNWNVVNSVGKSLKGFIGYKAGMVSLYVKDNTNDSMTKGKNIAVPSTILECPGMKIYSVRFYKDNKLVTEVLSENFDKELKRIVKLPGKKDGKKIDDVKSEEYNDIKVICYSLVKKTGLKKKPDLSEIGIKGSLEEKMHFIKEKIGKEISIIDVFGKGELVDLRGLTKGKGLSGPVRRFGIQLKNQKSEKGRRRPGSLGPWHPARVVYNNKILDLGKSEGKFKNIKNYGDVKTDYIIVKGSVQGPAKRQLLITAPLRETKKTKKKNYELIEIR